MHVLVVGAGLSGLTSAWFLARSGYQVTVVDRASGPGTETSFANGALLTPSMSDPWNAPGCWRTLLTSLGREHAPLQLRARTLPSLIGWGAHFLWHSASARHTKATTSNLTLAQYSSLMLAEIVAETGIEFMHRRMGSLRLFRDVEALERTALSARDLNLSARTLSNDEVVIVEPGLAPIATELAGAVHYASDEVGDAYRFCIGLEAALRERGVQFLWKHEVAGLAQRDNRIEAVVVEGRQIKADVYIIAAASHTPRLLRSVGVKLPIRPVKGYSLTIPAIDPPLISIPLVDNDHHAVVVPVGNALRVAGIAEFAGYDRGIAPARIDNLIALLRGIFPDAALNLANAKPWCGLRAMSVDGVPLIGQARFGNLYVNSGHGHLGWTLAAGSGQLVANIIGRRRPSIDPTPYAPMRFREYHG